MELVIEKRVENHHLSTSLKLVLLGKLRQYRTPPHTHAHIHSQCQVSTHQLAPAVGPELPLRVLSANTCSSGSQAGSS